MVDDDNSIEAEQYIREVVAQEMGQMSGMLGTGGFPEPPDKDSLLKFMRNVVDEKDDLKLSKTANFREEEVGKPKAPVLTYGMLSRYADSEGYDVVGDYLRAKAGMVATMSLGRKAKLLETLFTVRRETKNFGTPRTTTKKGFLGGETKVTEGVES